MGIESGEVALRGNMKIFARDFVGKFDAEWNGGKESASRIWSLGSPPYGECNVLVNMTKGAEHLEKVRSYILEGFAQMTCGGVLGDEPLRGVRVNLVDVKIHSDSAHHGAGQIVPAMVRAMRAGLLAATPKILEPIYSVEIEVPSSCNDAMNGVFSTFGMVRGEVPIVETLKNEQHETFTGMLRGRTKGKAFAVMRFARWKPLDGDPMAEDTMAHDVVMAIRKRKGMKMEMPSFWDFAAKI